MKKNKLIILTALTILSLSACSKKQAEPTEPAPLETIAPETTASSEISDKLEDGGTLVVPTIGVTEAVISPDGEVGTVGITETLEDGSYMAIKPDGDLMVTFNLPELSSGHEYTEAEAVALDELIHYWSENNISEEALRNKLTDGIYSGLMESDKEEIVTKIVTDNPHPNPEPESEEATEQVETESVDYGDTSALDGMTPEEIAALINGEESSVGGTSGAQGTLNFNN